MALIRLNTRSAPADTFGGFLQIKSSFNNTPFSQSVTGDAYAQVDNISVSITPSSTSSKMLISFRLFHEANNTQPWQSGTFIWRDSTKINIGTASGDRGTIMHGPSMGHITADAASTPDTHSTCTVDAPNTTSAIVYKIGFWTSVSATLYVNRTVTDSNLNYMERGSSELIVMELAG